MPAWVATLSLAEKWGCPPSVVHREAARWITRQDLLDDLRGRVMRKESAPAETGPDLAGEGWVNVVHPLD